jgi:hypothetical protein
MNDKVDSEQTSLQNAIAAINFKTLAEDAPVSLWLTDSHGKVIFTSNQY